MIVLKCFCVDIYTIITDVGGRVTVSPSLHPGDSGEAAAGEVTLRISMLRKKILQIMILMCMKSAKWSSPQMPALPLLPLPCCAATEEVVLIFLPLVSTRSLRGRALLITVSYLAAAVPGVDGEAALQLRERRRARVAGVGPAHLPPDGRGVRPQLATCAPVSNTAVSRR